MIVFFGPTGSGKSMQGQLMAVRHGWRWVSAGQLLRDISDPEIYEYLKSGQLVPDSFVNKLILSAVDEVRNNTEIRRVILDGYPRTVEQAKTLVNHCEKHDVKVDMVVVLNVDENEVMKRLRLRGRMEDDPSTIADRLAQYTKGNQSTLDYLSAQNVPVIQVNGIGSVGEVHDRIEKVLEDNKTIGAF